MYSSSTNLSPALFGRRIPDHFVHESFALGLDHRTGHQRSYCQSTSIYQWCPHFDSAHGGWLQHAFVPTLWCFASMAHWSCKLHIRWRHEAEARICDYSIHSSQARRNLPNRGIILMLMQKMKTFGFDHWLWSFWSGFLHSHAYSSTLLQGSARLDILVCRRRNLVSMIPRTDQLQKQWNRTSERTIKHCIDEYLLMNFIRDMWDCPADDRVDIRWNRRHRSTINHGARSKEAEAPVLDSICAWFHCSIIVEVERRSVVQSAVVLRPFGSQIVRPTQKMIKPQWCEKKNTLGCSNESY